MAVARSLEGVPQLGGSLSAVARVPVEASEKTPRRAGGGFRDMVPALLLLLASSLAIGGSLLAADERSEHVAIVAPLWYDAAQTVGLVSRAGGRIVDSATFANTIVATRGEDVGAQAFLDALRREGVWLTLDAGALRGCVGR